MIFCTKTLHARTNDAYTSTLLFGSVSNHNLNQLLPYEYGEKFKMYPSCSLPPTMMSSIYEFSVTKELDMRLRVLVLGGCSSRYLGFCVGLVKGYCWEEVDERMLSLVNVIFWRLLWTGCSTVSV
jgi:hypothetical protein